MKLLLLSYIIEYNEFDIRFIITPLSKQKKLNYKPDINIKQNHIKSDISCINKIIIIMLKTFLQIKQVECR